MLDVEWKGLRSDSQDSSKIVRSRSCPYFGDDVCCGTRYIVLLNEYMSFPPDNYNA